MGKHNIKTLNNRKHRALYQYQTKQTFRTKLPLKSRTFYNEKMISPLERQNMFQHLETRWRSKRTLNPSPLMRTLKSQLIGEQALTKKKKKKKNTLIYQKIYPISKVEKTRRE